MLHEQALAISPFPGRQQPVIAIIGSDGSGKSTVGEALYKEMSHERPTKLCHLGKQAGNLGRSLRKVPFFGKILEKRNIKEHEALKHRKESSTLAVLVAFVMSMRRVYRFYRMRCYHKRGFAILTDRYPQTLIPGPMDGPALADLSFKGYFLHGLMKLENSLYNRMTKFQPDLVIRLNVDLETALARKPDHQPRKLARKISDVGRLYFGTTPILDLSATDPLDKVLAQARKAVYEVMSAYPVKH
ncbi:nucleoside triphosphate hydrolase [Acetobacteraceae bacterium ESL0709]|nr:nucleoside triphosphate hydrolase [Acetobacteraceae bacterium ESL0697]MDF7677138.1 nucleoside triphosphate hydrolase [Acetobacteraceae bacterium ESL0709]